MKTLRETELQDHNNKYQLALSSKKNEVERLE